MLAELPILRKGNYGERVKALQDILNRLGFRLELDGVFGIATENAIKSFQAKSGLSVDGIVGQLTLDRLQQSTTMPQAVIHTQLPQTSIQKVGTVGIMEKINGPGVFGYPVWLETIMVGVAVYTWTMLSESSKRSVNGR
jgi:peptidoglycan hydrolase-like protein with peptidoglycan-binding domain